MDFSLTGPINIINIHVKRYRIIIYIECSKNALYCNEWSAKKILKDFPSLSQHLCRNNNELDFIDNLKHTSIPHIFEHLIIDSQISHFKKINKKVEVFGISKWENSLKNDGYKRARIEVSFIDDCVALNCIFKCVNYLNKTISEQII